MLYETTRDRQATIRVGDFRKEKLPGSLAADTLLCLPCSRLEESNVCRQYQTRSLTWITCTVSIIVAMVMICNTTESCPRYCLLREDPWKTSQTTQILLRSPILRTHLEISSAGGASFSTMKVETSKIHSMKSNFLRAPESTKAGFDLEHIVRHVSEKDFMYRRDAFNEGNVLQAGKGNLCFIETHSVRSSRNFLLPRSKCFREWKDRPRMFSYTESRLILLVTHRREFPISHLHVNSMPLNIAAQDGTFSAKLPTSQS